MTKGEPALAKFVENMNYGDIGYTDFISFQLAWWNFLETFVNPQIKSDVKFSVDMADMIKYGYFDPNTDHVCMRGAYNSWGKTQLLPESGTVYSATAPFSQFYFIEYKFFTDNSSAPNGGWESDFTGGLSSNRLLTVGNTAITLTTPKFNFPVPDIDLSKLQLRSLFANEIKIAGDSTLIAWELTNVPNINLEFSDDNGGNWQTLNTNISTTGGKSTWVLPNSISSQCKIRITDVSNPSNYAESNNSFRIVKPNEAGGPYLFDKNTVALFHFDNDLNNRSNMSENAMGDAFNISTNATLPADLGNCISTTAPIMVPHSTSLNLTGDWTIEAWVKFTSFISNNYMYLFNKPGDLDAYESNYSLQVNPWWNNVFYGFYFSATNSRIGVTSVSPSLNQWYHVAFIRDTKQSVISLIVHDQNRNLVSAISSPYTGTAVYLNTQNLQIGTGITGFIDEVRISNVVRNFINTEITETTNNQEFSVYPNPSDGIVRINTPKGISKGKVSIIDITGKTVYTGLLPDSNTNTLNLKHLNKGVYMVKLLDNERIWTKKVIIQ